LERVRGDGRGIAPERLGIGRGHGRRRECREIVAKFGKIARTCKSRHEKYRLKK